MSIGTAELTNETRVKGPRVRRRTVVVVLGSVCALIVAFLGGGGWYFAGQIRSDGLAVKPNRPDYTLTVVSYDGVNVTLREAPGHERDDTLRNQSVYGLRWPGGSGILGPAQSGPSDRSVIRPLTVKTASPPKSGTLAELHSDMYDDPASAYGVPFQDVAYSCAGGKCPAWYLPGKSETWAVMVHGQGAARTEPLRALGSVLRAGMPALVISYRNDDGAPRDPSGFYRFGATEWQDLENAVAYAQAHGARHVILFGFSMGASITAAFLQHSQHADAVTGVVLDAPMLNFQRTIDFGAEQRRLPLLGLPIPGALTWTAKAIADWQYDIGWKRTNYLDGRWLRVPALVFHGTGDKTVPIATSDEFAASNPQLVQEVRVDGAEHVESWNANPDSYNARVSKFLTRVRG
jgi:dienelactone hydrolase